MEFQELSPAGSYSGREGRTVVLGLAVSSLLLLLPKESENESQNFFLPSLLIKRAFGLTLLPHQKIWGGSQTHNHLICGQHQNQTLLAPYLDFIASEEFHLNGLLQYSLSVHVSSCLDYLSRKNTFRRAKRWLNNVLSTGLLHRPQEHTSTPPTCSLPYLCPLFRDLHAEHIKSYWLKDPALPNRATQGPENVKDSKKPASQIVSPSPKETTELTVSSFRWQLLAMAAQLLCAEHGDHKGRTFDFTSISLSGEKLEISRKGGEQAIPEYPHIKITELWVLRYTLLPKPPSKHHCSSLLWTSQLRASSLQHTCRRPWQGMNQEQRSLSCFQPCFPPHPKRIRVQSHKN